MRNIKLVISYDGTNFHGWQRQLDVRTVQQELEEAWAKFSGQSITFQASGRTDTGVHALGQVVNGYTTSPHPTAVIQRALNALLPYDVRVLAAAEVPQSFHSTLDAKRKMYRYVIDNAEIADPFQRRHSYHVPGTLDTSAMQRAGQHLVGRHNFQSFETNWPNRMSSVRTVMRLQVNRLLRFVWVDVEADGFLYNMVRTIAGTLIRVGKGQWDEAHVKTVLEAQDRRVAGPTAPPQGLFLMQVWYE